MLMSSLLEKLKNPVHGYLHTYNIVIKAATMHTPFMVVSDCKTNTASVLLALLQPCITPTHGTLLDIVIPWTRP